MAFILNSLTRILVLDDLVAACPTADTAGPEGGLSRPWQPAPNQQPRCVRSTPFSEILAPGVREIHNVWRVPFNPTDPINTPSGLNMGDASVVAVGMLTYGQSSDPASPFAYDQLEPLSRRQWPASQQKHARYLGHSATYDLAKQAGRSSNDGLAWPGGGTSIARVRVGTFPSHLPEAS